MLREYLRLVDFTRLEFKPFRFSGYTLVDVFQVFDQYIRIGVPV